ncbi:trace amine-associated receptor 1-like [Archocentrus centrarchus]|uniref:trace amine-associated receptor 1-like n=1 Tax=Archocentrus centrarchus TaxID=63155 RepID=UPI0011E9D2BE|nr:trace amine-associated receptor 1-like [Archocentrus centrarchus]
MEIQNEVELCFPQLLNSSCRKPTLHWSKAVLLNIVLSCIALITAALNLLVIISVSYFRQLHTPTNILLLSLAVSDFLVGLVLMPLEIFRNTTCWFLGDLMCSVYIYLIGILTCASVGNIVLISVDRYVAICDPLHYPTRITLKAARNLGVLVVVFLASYCPFYCYTLVEENAVNDPSIATVIIVFYLNACLNPLIYTLFYPWFRNAVKLIITLQAGWLGLLPCRTELEVVPLATITPGAHQ